MAYVSINMGFEELEKELDAIGGIDGAAGDILRAAAVPLEAALKKQCAKHRRTGKMADSIKAGKVGKFKNGGYYVNVAPTGTSTEYLDDRDKKRTRKKPVRNVELLAYIEYGTKKQAKQPLIQNAVTEARAQCEAILQAEYDKFITNRGDRK